VLGADRPGGSDAVTAGAGTVVLSHCWACNSSLWDAVAEQLVGSGHTVVMYDHRGHGDSSVGADPWTLSRLAADLATVLEQLDLYDVVVAGHSMGSFTTIKYAVDHPKSVSTRVRGLALVSTAAHGLDRFPFVSLQIWLLGTGFSRWVHRRARRVGLASIAVAFGWRPRRRHLELVADLFAGTPDDVRAGSFRAFIRIDERAGLADVDVPAVVLCGRRDRLTPPRLGRAVAGSMPHARFDLIPGAGHMLPLEAPDVVADAIRSL
jgi:pimeloyl-ACP methyl ester carboxylesterase